MWGRHYRRVPVEAVFEVFDRTAIPAFGLGADVLLNAGDEIGSQDVAALRFCKDKIRFLRMEDAVESITEADHAPVFVDDGAVFGARIADPDAIIL